MRNSDYCGDCKHINLTDIRDETETGRSYGCLRHPRMECGVTTPACEQFERTEVPLDQRW